MTWEVLNVIGTMAFAISGAIVAMREEYDLLGVYVLSFVTAFGGGAVRNVLLGLPVSLLWEQQMLFIIVFVVVSLLMVLPQLIIKPWNRWGHFFDAIGLSAFAIQGAMLASQAGHSLAAVIVAATLTGTGGGIIRDVLVGRKPLVFRDEIYALWAALAGFIVGMGWVIPPWTTYFLFVIVVVLRMVSVFYKWRLPKARAIQTSEEERRS
ncbi:trimeric intracellular cation channel family protein [Caldalkalibacillus uzonensis]|uniref:trimeric intracellular cation channel family protein n=1 Tax=Caldalkalibacillus uzonensis TaxID=353224 RepID=UPI0027D85154|nr:trimeric intracellular cation channel family protein [Caldalkalibacillus uzonensis]